MEVDFLALFLVQYFIINMMLAIVIIEVLFFFFLMAAPVAYGSSWARDWIRAAAAAAAYVMATATWDLSHMGDLHHSFQQHWILSPLIKARNQTHILTEIMSGL